ncbi:MAG: hypothetical protein AAB594_01835 [Patescibacteria group bacterium]
MENVDAFANHETADEVSADGEICPVRKERVPTRLPYDWELAKGINDEVIVEHFDGYGWCRGAGKTEVD